MTTANMSLAGRLVRKCAAGNAIIAGTFLIAAVGSAQQAPLPAVRQSAVSTPVPMSITPLPATSERPPANVSDHQSSLTVQQIVSRQENHFSTIKNAQGTVVHSEVHLDEQGKPQPAVIQYIFFAYEGNRSVTLTMPERAARLYRGSQGKIPWSQITSAFHVTGDTVYMIRKPEAGTSVPTVLAVPYNPAVHENNPLVAFHPRQISDETIPLRDLTRAIPNMQQRPTVDDVLFEGKPMVRIDFENPKVPGERLYYIIDPARGYLPVEIARMTGNQPLSISKITIGHTPDGTWIPAKRYRVMYDGRGKAVSTQSWEYEYLAVNKGLAPKTLSLVYFNLPLTTKVEVAGGKAPATPGRNGAAAMPARVPATPTPLPPRVAPTPMSVRLP